MSKTVINTNMKKLTLRISARDIVSCVICFALSGARLFGSLNPFCMAYFAASFSAGGWYYTLAVSAIATLISFGSTDALPYLLALGVGASVLGLCDRRSHTLFKALCMSLAYFAVCTVLAAVRGLVPFEYIRQCFEAFLCFVCVYLVDSAVPLVSEFGARRHFSARESAAAVLLFCMLMLGTASVPPVFGMRVYSFVSIFLIMIIGFSTDVLRCTASGVVLGTVVCLCGSDSVSVIGAYALGAIVSTCFKQFSRLGIVLGFTLANAVVTAFLNDTAQILINPVEVLAAGVLFVALPKPVLERLSGILGMFVCREESAGADNRILAVAEKKFDTMADSFEKIAAVYRRDCRQRVPGKAYVMRLFDYACANACAGCGLRFGCSGNRESTYRYMEEMLAKACDNGSVTIADLPKKFAQRCVKKDEFVKIFNLVYDIYKTDKLWLEKMCEARSLMASQMEGIAATVRSGAHFFENESDTEAERIVRSALDRGALAECDVNVLCDGDGRCSVYVTHSADGEPIYDTAAEAISQCLESPYRFVGSSQCGDEEIMHFCPAERYSVSSAVASVCKEGEALCGDCAEQIYPGGGQYIMTLSDGMGSGKEAYAQSRDTIEMLSSFLRAGFDADSAVRLVNSSLLLKSVKDCFSTIDMMCMNMENGEIRLSKIGAAPTYVRSAGKVRKIECTALPVGILRDIETETSVFDAADGAMVVMMSDGISNTVLKNIYEEDWIKQEIKNLNTKNPRVAASRILDAALSRCGGKAEDDMTVVVSLIRKN